MWISNTVYDNYDIFLFIIKECNDDGQMVFKVIEMMDKTSTDAGRMNADK